MKKELNSSGKDKNNIKKRNWTLIVYPESAPEDWIELIRETGLQAAISPLHDKDTNPNGELKKAHYHVILCYSGPTSFNVVNGLCEKLSSPIPKPLEQIIGMYRYFVHKDNPEKFQYDEKEIISINGFEITDFSDLKRSDVIRAKKEIQCFIIEKNITEYSALMDLLLYEDVNNHYEVAANNTYFFDKYITSRRNVGIKMEMRGNTLDGAAIKIDELGEMKANDKNKNMG